MDTSKTRDLFALLIKKPPLTDPLLQRPPFKFIHDVVRETIQATGYLSDFYSKDELDSTKAGADKSSKMSFLEKLVDVLNVDGSLNNVNPSKIVAGKEPEMTNLLLQKFAMEAAKHRNSLANGASKTKSSKEKPEKSSKSEKSSKKTDKLSKEPSKEKRTKSKEPEKKSSEKKEKKSKSEDSSRSKPKSKDRKTSKEKSERSKSRHESKRISDAGIDVGDSSPHDIISSNGPIERESSGGTSKGGEDSGIADDTGAESERHDSDYYRPRISRIDEHESLGPSTSAGVDHLLIPTKNDENEGSLKRPGTAAAARPQTAMGRPGTAAARPAPPKVKKTKVADLDTQVVSQQPVAFDKSSVIRDEESKEDLTENFLIEEEEEETTNKSGGIDINEIAQSDDHGQLVNRIIENTRELEKEAIFDDSRPEFYDINEQRKLRNEIESVQKALQKTTQTTHPLARILEFLTEDFDLMLREIEENRKQAAKFEQLTRDRAIRSNEASASLSATLRSLDSEIRDVKAQIGQTMARIIENEKKINAFLSS